MHAYLEEFASQCAEQSPPDTDEKFVGWDGLIITLNTKQTSGEWMDALEADWMLPESDTLALPDGTVIPTRQLELEASELDIPLPQYKPQWLSTDAPAIDKLPLRLSPSSLPANEDARVGEFVFPICEATTGVLRLKTRVGIGGLGVLVYGAGVRVGGAGFEIVVDLLAVLSVVALPVDSPITSVALPVTLADGAAAEIALAAPARGLAR